MGHTMSHLARVLTILLCQHACIVLLPVILIFFHMSSLREYGQTLQNGCINKSYKYCKKDRI